MMAKSIARRIQRMEKAWHRIDAPSGVEILFVSGATGAILSRSRSHGNRPNAMQWNPAVTVRVEVCDEADPE